MIRIVTRARLAALEQAAEGAQARTEEVQDAAAEAASCHTRSAQRLSVALAAARAAADEYQGDAEILRVGLAHMKAQLGTARAMVEEQAERIKTLRADLATMSCAVVLLRYGRLDSVHPDVAAAKRHARSLGAPADGWCPPTGKPASELSWRVCPLGNFVIQAEVSEAGAA
ncbi:hypothetical protein [Streptomyces sp. WZ-12]|uniref:hypothetical protein n=1 Tax=Streptomyces sp. WZ-12 TaxID=3030210 RepID=UPI002380D41D|nr:hypothetical protein [Streptomyces sp. WZ-12]